MRSQRRVAAKSIIVARRLQSRAQLPLPRSFVANRDVVVGLGQLAIELRHQWFKVAEKLLSTGNHHLTDFSKVARPLIELSLLRARGARTLEGSKEGVALGQYPSESLHHLGVAWFYVGEQCGEERASVLGSAPHDVHAFGSKDSEWERRG